MEVYEPLIHKGDHTYYERVERELGVNLISRLVGLKGIVNIADVGCNTGLSTRCIARLFGKERYIYGIDMNSAILARHQKDLEYGLINEMDGGVDNYELIHAQSPTLPFPEKYFDLIFDMNNSLFNIGSLLKLDRSQPDKFQLILPDTNRERVSAHYRTLGKYLSIGGYMVITKDSNYGIRRSGPKDIDVVIIKKEDRGNLVVANQDFDEESRIHIYGDVFKSLNL